MIGSLENNTTKGITNVLDNFGVVDQVNAYSPNPEIITVPRGVGKGQIWRPIPGNAEKLEILLGTT